MVYVLVMLLVYMLVMYGTAVFMTKKENNIERFCVGDRNTGWFISALSIAATWIWAPALFTSAETAYINGFAGFFWFLVPNMLCLVLFMPFAKRIRQEMPEGITLPGYMYWKYKSEAVKGVYLFQLGALAVLSTGVQLLAGSQVLGMLSGIPFPVMAVIMAVVAFSYSQFSGIKASMLTDAVQMVFMLAAGICFMFFGIKNSCGMENLAAGLGGVNGDAGSLLSGKGLEIFLGFGLPAVAGLISGPFGDQCFWQRAFCTRKDRTGRAFFAGALLFGIVPLSMGILGLAGAGMGYSIGTDTGITSFRMVRALFPAWASFPFLYMVVSGLLSTIDSNLCAVSSLTTDIFRIKTLGKAKSAMVLLLAAGTAIASIPGLTVTHLFLFYGTLRSATLLPTIFTLKGIKLKPCGIVVGVVSATAVGLPVFAYGNITDTAVFKTAGSLITVLLSGAVALAASKAGGTKNG